MKPTSMRNKTMYLAPMHLVNKQLAAPLSDELQQKYRKSSARVVEGDSVKVLRGEFKGIEGKVTNVSTERKGIAIEGIKREKLKGGNVDIYIHPSNVMITALNLEDKWRQSRLEGQKPSAAKPKAEEQKETAKPKEQQKEQPVEKKEEKKEDKPKQKETKAAPKTDKTDKKSQKTKKSDK
ncbi:MAG: 50S ribosomal protein L24 [Thaumarchaeota archaeon]|nr:50S ribosomal protein L24 [Nitrososphaerota archaeon]